jgi:hypothetical protein
MNHIRRFARGLLLIADETGAKSVRGDRKLATSSLELCHGTGAQCRSERSRTPFQAIDFSGGLVCWRREGDSDVTPCCHPSLYALLRSGEDETAFDRSMLKGFGAEAATSFTGLPLPRGPMSSKSQKHLITLPTGSPG